MESLKYLKHIEIFVDSGCPLKTFNLNGKRKFKCRIKCGELKKVRRRMKLRETTF